MMRISAATSQRTKSTPTTESVGREMASHRSGRPHIGDEFKILITVKYPSPSITTGIPNAYDSGDVVTFVQLSSPVPEQAKMVGIVKWAMVI
jgi:hypothetical protein